MEASENATQLDLDRAAPDGVVRAIEDRLVIERLTVSDERAAALVRERQEAGQEPARTVADAIEIGARVLDREDTAAEVDWVRAELERAQSGFERRGAELGERLSAGLEQGSEELAAKIADAFGAERSDSVQAQIREIVSQAGEAQKLELTRMLSSEDGSNPLTAVQARLSKAILESEERHRQEMSRLREGHAGESRAMQTQVAELKETVARLIDRHGADERLAEAEQAGTRKGRSFEERVDRALERIAATRGDASSHTGGEGAEGGGKKGDTLVELAAADGPGAGRMVFEAKDKKLSKNDAWKQLNEAMAARAASFAVLVVAGEERVPSGRETLTEYEGNKLIVAVDREEPDCLALEVAYRLAAARVAMARSRELTVDAAAVRDAAEEAASCLKQAQAIRATLTGIKTSSDKARATLDEMVEAVRSRLERVEALVEAAD